MDLENNQQLSFNEKSFPKDHPFLTYIIITLLIGTIGYLPWVLSSYGIIPFLFFSIYLGGLSPFLGALITSRLVYGKKGSKYILGQLGLNFKTSKQWIILAICFPFAIQFISMGLYMAFIGPIDLSIYNWFEFIPAVLIFSFYAMGEEFGWRAFGLPHLQLKYTAFTSSIILGVYWALWHWPHFLINNSEMLNLYGSIHLFILYTVLNSLYYSWFYNKSRANLLTCILLHGTENAMIAVIPLNVFVFIFFLKCIIVGAILILFRKEFFKKEDNLDFHKIRQLL